MYLMKLIHFFEAIGPNTVVMNYICVLLEDYTLRVIEYRLQMLHTGLYTLAISN